MLKKEDLNFMKLAVHLAKRGLGRTSPNPIVGAVLVKNHRVISQGFHSRFGGPHAEAAALKNARASSKGATLYVTLEPCWTYGKTPPCTKAILEAGITRVVVGSLDPNPMHHGKGVRFLRKNGVQVESGHFGSEPGRLILSFQKWITKKVPFCIVKTAMSLDGRIATSFGESKWITHARARKFGYRLRQQVDAILVGINTLMKDDPELTTHQAGVRDPLKVVVDSQARTPLDSKILRRRPDRTIIAVTGRAKRQKVKDLLELGVRVIPAPGNNGRVSLKKLFIELGKIGITSVLVEGGGNLMASIFEERLADKIFFFYSPILIGGEKAPTAYDGRGVLKLKNAISIAHAKASKIGKDFLIEGDVKYSKTVVGRSLHKTGGQASLVSRS